MEVVPKVHGVPIRDGLVSYRLAQCRRMVPVPRVRIIQCNLFTSQQCGYLLDYPEYYGMNVNRCNVCFWYKSVDLDRDEPGRSSHIYTE